MPVLIFFFLLLLIHALNFPISTVPQSQVIPFLIRRVDLMGF